MASREQAGRAEGVERAAGRAGGRAPARSGLRARPSLRRRVLRAMARQKNIAVGGIVVVLLVSVFFVAINLAVDLLYAMIDPRIRYA